MSKFKWTELRETETGTKLRRDEKTKKKWGNLIRRRESDVTEVVQIQQEIDGAGDSVVLLTNVRWSPRHSVWNMFDSL